MDSGILATLGGGLFTAVLLLIAFIFRDFQKRTEKFMDSVGKKMDSIEDTLELKMDTLSDKMSDQMDATERHQLSLVNVQTVLTWRTADIEDFLVEKFSFRPNKSMENRSGF